MLSHSVIKKQINLMPKSTLKAIIGRERLCYLKEEIIFYLVCIMKHQKNMVSFLNIHKKANRRNLRFSLPEYSAFMNNINALSKLMHYLFLLNNRNYSIKKTQKYSIIDSTLIPEKEGKYITQKDFDTDKVAARRDDKGNKIYICGSKGLFILNEKKQVIEAKRIPIVYSDQNILKDSALYQNKIEGVFLLADKGFSSKLTRQRVEAFNCKMISPYRKSQKDKDLTKEEWDLYRERWKIETFFQKLKGTYGNIKLNLKGKYSNNLKNAKFFATCLMYNLSTVKK